LRYLTFYFANIINLYYTNIINWCGTCNTLSHETSNCYLNKIKIRTFILNYFESKSHEHYNILFKAYSEKFCSKDVLESGSFLYNMSGIDYPSKNDLCENQKIALHHAFTNVLHELVKTKCLTSMNHTLGDELLLTFVKK
jgi:hypothetical protein